MQWTWPSATRRPPPVTRDRRALFLWLAACVFLVAMMVLIGGYTRLSGSGLSITEWQPIHGVIPPFSTAAWRQEFSAYKATPQYKQVNAGMTLSGFQAIFWPEYIHRLLGRAIGLVFFLPLVIFAARRSFSKRFFWRLVVIFALGGLQGAIGWLMVRSGLVNTPAVSPVRLALHLSTALLIYALLLWAAMDVVAGGQRSAASKHFPLTAGRWPLAAWFSLLCLQIILGALMAGLHAGLLYNTWPDMNGHFLPESRDTIATIQFLHRNVAILVAAGFLFWWYLHRGYVKNARLGKVCAAVAAIIALQFMLGVATLLHQAPLPLALAHQMTALVLFTVAVIILWRVKRGHST
ncbi:MAG: COX15/CtaA family protein [Pseudomonadota bacterium]|nr:COX15/CtaA family protein [Pseudomonadota bacterium]MDE3036923.1 COX15/CtaA family protein [Pseudomonadota bacterium]